MSAFRDLLAYKKGFDLAMKIFVTSKSFPREELFSLTDQIRRSSRSVCTNTGEAYRKRRYPNHFISKLTDADAENTETRIWLEFAFSCEYITEEKFSSYLKTCDEIGKLLNFMISNPYLFGARELR